MDKIIRECAEYVLKEIEFPKETYQIAAYCLLDALGCAALALNKEVCNHLLGPVVRNTNVPGGARVLGTQYKLDPIKAAFDIGTLIRWLDYNDTFLAKEWGHPSDNLGAILACCDYRIQQGQDKPINLKTVLNYLIKAYEIQGCLALDNSFNAVGLDHVVLVKVASTAVATAILDGDLQQVEAALSQAWLDGQSLRTYRHYPNTGPRKSWAAGDATARGVKFALMTLSGEPGYSTPLSAPVWGFQEVLFRQQVINLNRSLKHYVADNILFKVSFPAEFHAQTAVESAFMLHEQCKGKLSQIKSIIIQTQEPAIRIISKQGPLKNPADRDHCIEYMVAVALLFGELTPKHYDDNIASDHRIDGLREKTQIVEDKSYTQAYYDSEKRAIPNAVKLLFNDGTESEKIEVFYPLGHKRRREEAIPLIQKKALDNLSLIYAPHVVDEVIHLLSNAEQNFNINFEKIYNYFLLQ